MDTKHQPTPREVLETSKSSFHIPQPPSIKRRKLRRGTQSCWECKRRKSRCSFTTARDTTCEGCEHRGTRCLSQELPYEATSIKSGAVGARLKRLEDLMEQVLEELPGGKKGAGVGPASSPPSDGRNAYSPVRICSGLSQMPQQSTQVSFIPPSLPDESQKSYNALCTVWPTQHDLDIILNSPDGASWPPYGVIYRPYCRILPQDMPPPKDVLQPPRSGSHPALIARKLFLLGTFLQGLLGFPRRQLHNYYAGTMDRVVNSVSTTVTSNDGLIDSVEGIECLMMEANFHNTSGNLRQAWLTMRRAMAIAQSLGLHQKPTPTFVRILEPETRIVMDVEYMWFRMVHFDRYLSLVLGLPQGSLDDGFASPSSLERWKIVEQFERIECVAAGHILRCSVARSRKFNVSQDIETMLKESAACMPARWWRTPTPVSFGMGGNSRIEAMANIYRLMNHFMHYSLLIQSHLPCLLENPTEGALNHGTLTAMAASREFLTRYSYLHDSEKRIPTYYRGVDSLAFVAGATLSLTHMLAHRFVHNGNDNGESISLDQLKQQRLADRRILEKTLEIFKTVVQDGADKAASKLANVLRVLLLMEAHTVYRRRYTLEAIIGLVLVKRGAKLYI